jgi:branched-chain amino acid transport system permease protein
MSIATSLRARPQALMWALLAVLLVLAPMGLDPTSMNLMVLICINTLVAIGLSLLFGYAGQISLAQAQFMGLGAYTSAIMATRVGTPFIVSLVVAGIVPGIVAYVVGRPILRLKGYYLAMATVAIGGILATLFEQLKGLTGGFNGIVGIPRPALGNRQLITPSDYYYLVLIAAVLVTLFAWNLTRSRVGRAMRAIREAEVGASVIGVNVSAVKAAIFAFGAVTAGLAGSFYAHYTLFISPETFTISQSVSFILILAIGGMGSIGGAITGAILLTVLPQWLRRFGEYDNLIYGAMVIVVIMFLPSGLWGGLRDLTAWILRRFGAQSAASIIAADEPVVEPMRDDVVR